MSFSKLDTITRQSALTEAALALAAECPPSEVTTADLAGAVGITQGAVYRHFPSKEAIWLAVIDRVHLALMERLQHAADDHADEPLQALRAMFLAHVAFVMAYPGAPRVIFHELQSARETELKLRVHALMDDYRQRLIQVLRRAHRRGQLADGVELTAASALFIGAIQGLVMQTMISGELHQMRLQAPKVFELWQQAVARPAAGKRKNQRAAARGMST